MKETICLNMIVKNESEIIIKTLKNLCQHIEFDYWVISDTGSTDNTKELISNFFKEKSIPGELVEHEWKDFAYNRTKALECAFNKTDYLLIFDADDSIEGKFQLPKIMNKDIYNLKFGPGFEYFRPLLITNRKKFYFKGVLHEYLQQLEGMTNIHSNEIIQGNYYIISGRYGNRSKNPTKYYDDAIILKNAFEKEMNDMNGDKSLASRYAFYCAQSYKDTGNPLYFQESINWYKKVLELNNWTQEKYYSCLIIGELYKKLNDNENALTYWIKSSEYDYERIEGIVNAMDYLRNKGNNIMVNLLYEKFKNYNKNISEGKLFIDKTKYNDLIEFNNSICAYYTDNKSSGYECCKKIIMNNIISPELMKLTMSNIMFYKDFMEKDTDKTMYNRFILKPKEIKEIQVNDIIPFFSKQLCKESKNILFYTGFSDENWNYSYMKEKSLGGSEKAVAYLSTYFPKEYNIYISGGVENEHFDNITYINLNQLQNLINTIPFHTIICSRYIGFLEMYKKISFYQFYIWAQDTVLLPYGCNLTSNQIITKWDKYINGCICQTNWHANEYKKIYPELKDKIIIINNGIDISLFTYNMNNYSNKKNNKFIYTSRVERGLRELLELWSQILLVLPDATLVISNYVKFSQDNNNHMECKRLIDKYPDSVTHLGQLNSEQLYYEMSTSEYWLYPTSYPETSCITALEMLMSGVICLYYPVAGLVDTIKDYGLIVKKGNEISTLINLSIEQKNLLRENGIKYTKMCSWENRAKEWNDKVLNLASSPNDAKGGKEKP